MGDSSTSGQIDWRKLFAATSDQSLDYLPSVISEDSRIVLPPLEAFDEGLQTWKFALVGQFVGRAPSFSVIQKLVGLLWGKEGVVEVSIVDDNLFIFRFVNSTVRDWVLENGPWHIQNNSLILRRWEPNMKILDFNLDRIHVWFHLRGIPLELFSRKGLSCIASAIGHPLYMDSVIASKQRLSYAKVCIEISTETLIPDSIEVKLRDGFSVSVGVEVPWLPPKCYRCSIFGHSHKNCFNKDQVGVVAAKVQFTVAKNVGKSMTAKSPEVSNQVLTSLPFKAVAVTPYPSTKGKVLE
ncbi:hypothetical protein V6N13_042445 [Hibiscus sabdariffa]